MKNTDVFLSYSPADKIRVDELVVALQEAGVDVWFDEGGQLGPKHLARIEAAIEECRVFLLVSSKAALLDARVKGQYGSAYKVERQIQSYQIEDLPKDAASAAGFGELDTIEAFGEHQSNSVKRLLAALEEAGVARHPPEVFISYSRKDAKLVHRIAQNLRKARIPIWIDRAKIRTGTDWDTQIVQALKSCKIVVLARSTHSLKSDPVAQELKLAEDFGKRILQLRLSGPLELPNNLAFVLARDHFLDVEGKSEDAILEELLKELAKLDESIESDERAIDAAREEQAARARRRRRRYGSVGATVVAVIGTYAWTRPNPVWAGEAVAIPEIPAYIVESAGVTDDNRLVVEYWCMPTIGDEERIGIVPLHAGTDAIEDSLVFNREVVEDPSDLEQLLNGMDIEARLFLGKELRGRFQFALGSPPVRDPVWDTSHVVFLRIPDQYFDRDEVTISLRSVDGRSDVLPPIKMNTGVHGAVLIGESLAGMDQSSRNWLAALSIPGEIERTEPQLQNAYERWHRIYMPQLTTDVLKAATTLVAVMEVVDPNGEPTEVGRSEIKLGDDLFVDIYIGVVPD